MRPLLRDPLRCIVPHGWPAPAHGVMTPAAMRGQKFVIQGESTDADIQNYLKKYRIETHSCCRVVDDMSNIAMVEAGVGIALLPQLVLHGCTAAVDIWPLEPQEARIIGLSRPNTAAPAPAAEQMEQYIVEYCAQRPDAI